MSNLIETEIGTISSDWNLVKLGEISENPQYGFTTRASDKGNVKFLRITDIGEWEVNWEQVPFCNCSNSEIEKYKLKTNDIVFARIGATTGKSYIIKRPPHAVFASYLIRIRTNKEIHPDFLIHFFKSSGYWQQINASKNSNLKKGVNGSVLKSLLVPKPPLPEQKNIAHILSTVQQAIEQQERIIALTTELKKALMHKLFTEGLHGEPQKDTEIGPVPESWEVMEFEKFTTLQRGKDLTQKNFKNGDIPVAGSNGIIGFHNVANVSGPGVTVGRSGSAGKVTYYETDFWAHNTSLYVKDFHNNHPKFAAYYLEFLKLDRFKSGASVPTLDRNQFRRISIAVPPKAQQIKISHILSLLDDKINVYKRKKEALQHLFRTLLHQLMTAQIRVHELEFGESV